MLEFIRNLLNAAAEGFDLPILEWIQANLQCAFLDFTMPIVTVLGDAGIFWIGCAVVLLLFKKHRKTGLAMGIALVMGLIICNITLKPLIGRIRPYNYQIEVLGKTWEQILITGKLLVETPHDFSFPSGHTIASFEAAVAILLNNKKLGIPAMILACLIAFSRMYLYVHYPTDVICSIIIGSLFAFLANWMVHKIADKFPSHKGKYQK